LPTSVVLMHEAAEAETRMLEEPAPAEQVIDHLRTERAQQATLTPEQARTERVAELTRRLKASRRQTGGAPADRPESVDEAITAINTRRQTEKQDEAPATTAAAETARKLRAHREETEAQEQARQQLDPGPRGTTGGLATAIRCTEC
jgi:chromatin remodeling complex protein RSC6